VVVNAMQTLSTAAPARPNASPMIPAYEGGPPRVPQNELDGYVGERGDGGDEDERGEHPEHTHCRRDRHDAGADDAGRYVEHRAGDRRPAAVVARELRQQRLVPTAVGCALARARRERHCRRVAGDFRRVGRRPSVAGPHNLKIARAVYLIAKRLFYPSVAKRLGESSWLAEGALC
jgi:hypothetical protein